MGYLFNNECLISVQSVSSFYEITTDKNPVMFSCIEKKSKKTSSVKTIILLESKSQLLYSVNKHLRKATYSYALFMIS